MSKHFTTRWAGLAIGLMAAAAVLGALATVAPVVLASPLRPLAASVTSFASDGIRYAVWQDDPLSPVTILDTDTGARRLVQAPGCVLENERITRQNEPIAGGGRFLLSCFAELRDGCFMAIYKELLRCGEKLEGESAEERESRRSIPVLLDARTGIVSSLPAGGDWGRVGALYVEGGSCISGQPCVAAFYDLATGTVSERRSSPLEQTLTRPDLNRPGAPVEPLCRALRRGLDRAEPETFAYRGGVLARLTHDRRNVRVERCRGHGRMLPGPSEPPRYITYPASRGVPASRERLLPSEPNNFDVGDGVLTWSTGHDPTSDDPSAEPIEYGTLSAYQLAGKRLRTWRLPLLTPFGGEEYRGAFGYSAHTSNTVFWLAARDLSGGEAGPCCVETSYLYAARF
jgi:hypothetical protein